MRAIVSAHFHGVGAHNANVPTELLSMMSCALVFAAMMCCGLAARAPVKKVRRKLMVGNWEVVGLSR